MCLSIYISFLISMPPKFELFVRKRPFRSSTNSVDVCQPKNYNRSNCPRRILVPGPRWRAGGTWLSLSGADSANPFRLSGMPVSRPDTAVPMAVKYSTGARCAGPRRPTDAAPGRARSIVTW